MFGHQICYSEDVISLVFHQSPDANIITSISSTQWPKRTRRQQTEEENVKNQQRSQSLVSRLSHVINFAQQLNEATLRAKNQLEIWLSRLPSAPLGHSSYIFRRKNHFRTARFFLRAGWVNTQPRFQEDTYVWGAF